MDGAFAHGDGRQAADAVSVSSTLAKRKKPRPFRMFGFSRSKVESGSADGMLPGTMNLLFQRPRKPKTTPAVPSSLSPTLP
jgi:hypothetical protein